MSNFYSQLIWQLRVAPTVIAAFFVFTMSGPAQAQFFGVSVQKFKGSVVRPEANGYRQLESELTMLAVYPQPGPEGLFIGIDPSEMLAHLQKNPMVVVNKIGHHFMDVIQNAYFQIADERGLFKMGSAFQKQIASAEPFWDGRSAAIALFEGNDFSKPLATFRVAYATADHPRLPLEKRLGIQLEKFRSETPLENLAETDIDSVLGLNMVDREVTQQMGRNFKSNGDPASMFFGSLMEKLSGQVSTAHTYLLPDGRQVPFSAVLKAALQQANDANIHRPLIVGGRPVELKGLSHAQNTQHTDYMSFLLKQAVQKGFFDVIPHINGFAIPTSFAAETPVGHVTKEYKDWHWKVLHTLYDAVFSGEVAVVEFGRADFGNLIPFLFNRATRGLLPDSKADRLDSQSDFDRLLTKSAAETLAFDPHAPLFPLRMIDLSPVSCADTFRP